MEDIITNTVVPTKYWIPLDNGRSQCLLCPRNCILQDGQSGLCFVRANQAGKIVLVGYGLSSGIAVDPIEKKPLYHFLPGSGILSFGTIGCNLNCKFCQNWNISKSRELNKLKIAATPEQIVNYAKQLSCKSIAYTYNDPVIFHEYAIDIAKLSREIGIKSVAVTAGYVNSEPREEFYRYIDAANVDLKSFSEKFYRRLTGGHLQPVLETLKYLRHKTSVWLEITTLIIPGENDSESEIELLTNWIVEHLGTNVPLHLSAFHPDWKMRNKSPTQLTNLLHVRTIAQKNGIRYVYIGNVNNIKTSSTYCHKCGQCLIGRNGYKIVTWKVTTEGNCSYCQNSCAGIFV